MHKSALRRGATGFLHPIHVYEVLCGSRRVHTGRVKREAVHCFRRFQKWSADGQGIAAGQTIRFLIDGKESEL